MKKTLNSLSVLSLVAGMALVVMTGCTDRQRGGETGNLMQDRNAQQAESDTREVIQQPGSLDSTAKNEKGSATVEARKQVTKTETDRESVPTIEQKNVRADINRMEIDDFVVMGMSRNSAQAIVDYRKQHGNFKSADELSRVPGVDTAWLQKSRDKLAFTG